MLELARNDEPPWFENLSDVQKQAVQWNEGPLLVLAGPGSGKTRVLTNRVARLLHESSPRKWGVLALTFTNKAADEMRTRVEGLVPEQTDRISMGTFHSFCSDVLHQHGSYLGIRPSFRIYSERADQDAFLEAALDELRAHGMEPGPGDRKVIPVIERLRAKLVAPTEAPDHVRDESLRGRITAIYQAYEDCLRQSNALDFASMLYYTVILFRRFPALAKHYRQVYPYWCIDEFQDTNHAQYELVRAMAGGEFKNLFAVADDDQIIYEWNGASHRRIEQLVADFNPRIVQLATNFRCPPAIVALANRLISHNTRRMPDKKPLDSGKPALSGFTDVVRLLRCHTDRQEVDIVADDIAARHVGKLHKVAILARNRRLLELAREALTARSIPALVHVRRDAFVSSPFLWLHTCLRQSNQRREVKNLLLLCSTFLDLTGIEIDARDVMAAADAGHEDYLRQWAEMAAGMPSPGQEAARAVTASLVVQTDHTSFIKFATKWLETLVNDGQSEPTPRFPGYDDDKRAWEELYRDITHQLVGNTRLEVFLQALDLRSKAPSPEEDTVVLMTIHGSKSKEFDHVYLMGLVEDELPTFQARKQGATSLAIEEERRNCFVAITRARETLTISYANSYRGWNKEPSRFLEEAGIEGLIHDVTPG